LIGLAVKTPLAAQNLSAILEHYGYENEKKDAFIGLLSLYHIDITNNHEHEITRQHFVSTLQKKMLRQGERFDNQSYNRDISASLKNHRQALEEYATVLGLVQKIEAPASVLQQSYIALIPGGLESRILHRLELLQNHIKQGYTPAVIIGVTGYRLLNDDEAADILLHERTEQALLEYYLNQLKIEHARLQNTPLILSSAALKEGQIRSNTFDTAEELAANHSAVFKINSVAVLYIEQPFAPRFLSIFKTTGYNIFLHSSSCESLKDDDLYIYGDEIARRIYFIEHQK
jgi:hypothetical protein